MPDSLSGRAILVTGAGQGLGRIAAMACARHGAGVILLGRSQQKLEAVYDEITTAGGPEPAILPLDLASATQKDLEAMAGAIHTTFGRLDGIFHGASHFQTTSPLESIDLESWRKHANVNLLVPAAITKSCLPLLRRSPSASVVFLGETHARAPAAFWGAFAVPKAALESLVAVWSEELSLTPSVRINLWIPGPIASPMRARSHPAEAASRLPQLEDQTGAILYLLGDASSDLRGACVASAPNSG
ncbi:MAG TPA: SDR family NAD(P)-dependent oxidoreductase [Usitatibacteraceae bacterium]|nr:SDR family NAD(P)-dependent oxidoreductase [Usitatibacteraceae bacterium]